MSLSVSLCWGVCKTGATFATQERRRSERQAQFSTDPNRSVLQREFLECTLLPGPSHEPTSDASALFGMDEWWMKSSCATYTVVNTNYTAITPVAK